LRGLERGRAQWHPGRRRRQGDTTPIRSPAGYLLVAFLLYTGCRKSEAAHLRIDDIRGERAEVEYDPAEFALLTEHKTDSHKGTREIILGPEAQRVLAAATEFRKRIRYTGPLVFPGRDGAVVTNVGDFLETALSLGGVKERIVPHSLRSAYINYAVRQGVPFSVVSRNVGHSDEATTRGHYEVITRELRQQGVEKMHEGLARLRAELGWEQSALSEVA
jgi:integrase